MNTWQLAEDFRLLFAADIALAALGKVTAQEDTADVPRPRLVFTASDEPFTANGKGGKFTLTITVESPADNTTDSAHSARVKLVTEKLHASVTKAALIAALNATGRWQIIGYNSASQSDELQGFRFETPVRIVGTAREL